ncbi:zinc knuckle CX2CX4HX4C [Artemisia annua]|uniref:Zinc knuckle CX2CX4HX4C n=1 Tax=Artemisia annua TaxID=35608 RepID=A0A2U1LNM3_ARTAN|nr:zinc knuckle CX2CX4HX4C [Artemisia annua]
MSEQEPKPPNPNELTSPPPVVNPPSSRSEKNLKTKKTTRTMNPKPASTMKHHDMLSKSTDVNFKRVNTRSSYKGSEAGMVIEEMDCGDEAGNRSGGKDAFGEGSNGAVEMRDVVNEESVAVKNDAVKNSGVKEGVVVSEVNGNVSDMFPELIGTNVSQGNVDKLPNIPVPFEQNPILNPDFAKNIGVKSSLDASNTVNVDIPSNNNVSVGDKVDVFSTKDSVTEVGESSNRNDVVMKEQNKDKQPMSFSNAVKGIASRIGTPIIMDKVTMSMCEKGYGRANFARVLIEVDASKGVVDSVEFWYRSLNRTMKLRVEYAWQPPICSHCCVFGHSYSGCNKRVLSEEEKIERSKAKMQSMPSNNVNNLDARGNEGWQDVQYKK